MTPADRKAMDRAFDDALHIPDMVPWSDSFADGFFAGLAHARAECAAQLEARASELDGLSYACSFAAEAMRKEAAKMRGVK